MPFLARIIAQRLIVVGVSVLTFFGVSPEVEIPTEEQAQINTEERQELIQETIAPDEDIEKIISEEVPVIPIPKTNILEVVTANITPQEQIKTPVPQIDPVPIKTNLPVQIPEQTSAESFDPSEIKIPEFEIVEKPAERFPDRSEESSIENSVVNILCMRQIGNKIFLSTGSGVIISNKGVVLTNAHVAQHFLLKEEGYECSLRRENIPTYGFEAEPLYISEKWIEENYRLITNPAPTGTGEDDYALLLITKNTNPTLPLPSKFSYMKPNVAKEELDIGDRVTIAAYPGTQTGIFDIDSQTKLKTDKTSIRNVFTFERASVDVVSTSDTDIAQKGSSGGGMFKDDELVGIIVTTNPGSSPTQQIVNALTVDYINRDLRKETGKSISNYLSGDLEDLVQNFQSSAAPRLVELLQRHL